MKKLRIVTIMLSLAFIAAACSSNTPKDSGMEVFKPGAYRVTVDGHNGPVTVVTTFTKDKVEKIAVEEHGESAGVGDTAMQAVADSIIAKQSYEVDIVSGATYSSYALLEAVSTAAIKGAGANAEIIKMPKPEAAQENALHTAGDNEFIGIGKGIGGDIEVKVTMEGDVIASVEVLSHNETAGICDKAISEIPKAIVKAQSSKVDSVSGATLSSNGIMQAVKDAVGK